MDALVEFTQSLPAWLQWFGVMLAGVIPFVESHFAALIGGIAGVPLPLAIAAAAVGNIASVALVVAAGDAVRSRARARRASRQGSSDDSAGAGSEASPRRKRFQRIFNRFGVPGVGLIGQMFIPNQFTAAMMLALGASRRSVLVWTTAGIVLWSVLFALLGRAGLVALGG